MDQSLSEFEMQPPARPMFLKVLCILTFIGSGLGIINSAYSYFNAEKMANAMKDVKTELNEGKNKSTDKSSMDFKNKVMKGMETMSTPENLRTQAIGTLVTSALCILGALFMWNLRRSGFYIYTLGVIISIIIPFYLFGNNFMTNIAAGAAGFVGVLFIIFYAMNLKSMTKS